MRCCVGDEGCGPSAAPFGGASNRLMLGWLTTVVVSDEEKAPGEVSGGDREGERKRTAVDVSKSLRRHRTGGRTELPGWAWRVPEYWPGGVRHLGGASLVCGSCTERGKAGADTARPAVLLMLPGGREGARQRRTPETLSTGAAPAGGPARSSAEAPVMGVERRGRLISWFVRASNRTAGAAWEETSEQVESDGEVVCHFQAAGVGGVSAGQGQPGRAGGGRAGHRGVRGGSEEQLVSDLEPDVVGVLLPAAGAGGADTQTATADRCNTP